MVPNMSATVLQNVSQKAQALVLRASDMPHVETQGSTCPSIISNLNSKPLRCSITPIMPQMEHIKTIKTTLNWILARDQAQVDGMGVGLDHGEGYGDGNANGAGAGDADGDGRDDLDNHRDEIGDDDGRKKSS